MDSEENAISGAWRAAAQDLGIRVTAPFVVPVSGEGDDAVEFPARIQDFGSAGGMLVARLDDPVRARERAAARVGASVSWLDPPSYAGYDRELFIATLNDWVYRGAASPPAWYTGEPWTS